MKKLKITICVIVLLTIIGSLLIVFVPVSGKADSKLPGNKVIFLHMQSEYSEEMHVMLLNIATIDNEGKLKNLLTEVEDSSDLFQNIDDPNALLMMAEEYNEEKKTQMKEIPIETVRKIYQKISRSDNRTEYEYSLPGKSKKNTKSTIYMYSYDGEKDYRVYQLYSADTAVKRLIVDGFDDYLEYLFKFFK